MLRIAGYLWTGFIAVLISACGGGGSGGDCNTALTVEYVNNEFATEALFVSEGFSASGTTLIHEDGNQGSEYDIDRIILSRVSHSSGNTLALSFSVHSTKAAPTDSYIGFFIDTDNNPSTGLPVSATLGADLLIVDDAAVLGDHASLSAHPVYSRSGSAWVEEPLLPGGLASSASYFQGCSSGNAIFIPMISGLDSYYGQSARGMMAMVTLTNADPNTPSGVLDSTAEFDFTVP